MGSLPFWASKSKIRIKKFREAPIVSAIFQGIGTLKFSPILADTFILSIEKY